MKPNKIISASELVNDARKQIDSIFPFSAHKKINDKKFNFIDVRDIRELWREGKITGAFHAPRGMLEFWVDPNSPYYKKIFTYDKTYILYCASGWRSSLAALTLKRMGMTNVINLEGGFDKWKKCNLPITNVEK